MKGEIDMTSSSYKELYAKPMVVNTIDECEFYHVMEVPGVGICGGKWDLRDGVDQYLGGVNFSGKRVLELGTASGFLCFEMEKREADVVSFDIGEDQEWDIIPFVQYDYKKKIDEFRIFCKRLKNAYWYAHKANNSYAKVVYGSIYNIPEEIGAVDIATFCSILLHLRDPFLALQNAAKLVKETIIVTDLAPDSFYFSLFGFGNYLRALAKLVLLGKHSAALNLQFPYMKFLPNFRTLEHKDVWWQLSPNIIINFLGILGFTETKVTYHFHELFGRKQKLFTVVAKRTA